MLLLLLLQSEYLFLFYVVLSLKYLSSQDGVKLQVKCNLALEYLGTEHWKQRTDQKNPLSISQSC